MFTFFHGCGIPPVTLTCPQGGAQAQTILGPTGSYATVCGPTRVPGCTSPIQTWFKGCGIPPVTLTCPPAGGAQAQTIGVTGWHGCIQTANPPCVGPTGTQGCTMPPHCFGPTGTQGCTVVGPTGSYATVCGPTHVPGCNLGPTGTQGCTQGGAQAQTIFGTTIVTVTVPATIAATKGIAHAANVGPTGSYATVCGPTHVPGCNLGPTGTQGCTVSPPPSAICATSIGCNITVACGDANAQTLGPTAYQGCGGTMATVCTQVGCGPTHLLGCTGYQGCHQPQGTAATVCTEIGCNDGGAANAQIPSIPVADCIPTRSCTGAWPVC